MGMSTGKIPSVYDKVLADNIFTASCESAFDITKTLALKEGILLVFLLVQFLVVL